MAVPAHPKIYHILHVDRLASVATDGYLRCDAEVTRRSPPGSNIGMNDIKQGRLALRLSSRPDLHVVKGKIGIIDGQKGKMINQGD